MKRPALLLLLLILISISPVSWAETPPIPKKKQDIQALQNKLKEQTKDKHQLKKEIKNIELSLEETKETLVDLAREIQGNEGTLQNLEIKILDLEQEKASLESSLNKNRQSISNLILALQRIRRIPPEALVVKPDAPLKTAQSAMLMRDIIPVIYKKADILREDLEKLEGISTDLVLKKDTVLKTNAALKQKQITLSALVEKRETLYRSTRNDLKAQEQNVQRISMQAKNLQDLVQKLDKDEKKQTARNLAKRAVLSRPSSKLPDTGRFQLPISGLIKTKYDEPDYLGAPSKGLSIEGRGGALVVAPMGGIVRFSGYFKNYGNLVILEHKNGYHSLVAGLEKIDTVVGQNISVGEPLGLLHHSNSGQKPVLYYELRKAGKPINPAVKFADLG